MNGSTLKERGISLIVSLSFHAALLFFLIKVVPPVRGYLYRSVVDVKIVSPETIYFPRTAGLAENNQSFGVPSAGLLPEETDVREAEVERQVNPDTGIVYLRNLEFGRETAEIGDPMDFSAAAPLFDLVPSPKSKGGFSLDIGERKSESEDFGEKKTQKTPDFSDYTQSALASLRFNRIVTEKEKTEPTGSLTQNMFGQPEGYDITPWVRDVVDKIRNNWNLPPIEESIAMGEVKILIVIGKQGNLVSMEIVEPSDFQTFDRTTVAAIRSSAPFPPLPDDFSSDRLEAYLVFQFDE